MLCPEGVRQNAKVILELLGQSRSSDIRASIPVAVEAVLDPVVHTVDRASDQVRSGGEKENRSGKSGSRAVKGPRMTILEIFRLLVIGGQSIRERWNQIGDMPLLEMG